jgi:ABC-type uncharacterized transport system ATPase component
MVTHSMQQAASLGDQLIMMDQGRIIHTLEGDAKTRARPADLLAKFEAVRQSKQLDRSAAEVLQSQYV